MRAASSFGTALLALAAMAVALPSEIEKRGYTDVPDCSRWDDQASPNGALDGINNLFARGGDTCGSAGDGSVIRLECNSGAGIFVSSQANGQGVYPSCNDVATYAQQILGQCEKTGTVATPGGISTLKYVSGNVARADPAPGYFVDIKFCD